jgi:heme-degrading monooxygenase HmoA
VIVTVFRSYARKNLDPKLLAEAEARDTQMLALASKMPGFVSYKQFQAADGEGLAVVEFQTLEHVRAWHDHPEHLAVQQWGRDNVFGTYHIQTCEVVREFKFPRA